MLPKSSKHYVIPTAEALNVSSQLVQDAVSFYYAAVRKALTDLKCHNIQVENLGSFKAKAKELPKLEAKYKKHLSVLKTETFNQMAIKKDIEGRLEKVLALKEMINQDMLRKKEFMKNKHEKANKKPNTDLEK